MLLNQLPKPNGKEKDGRKGKVAAVIQSVKDFEKLQKLDFFNQCLQSPVRKIYLLQLFHILDKLAYTLFVFVKIPQLTTKSTFYSMYCSKQEKILVYEAGQGFQSFL